MQIVISFREILLLTIRPSDLLQFRNKFRNYESSVMWYDSLAGGSAFHNVSNYTGRSADKTRTNIRTLRGIRTDDPSVRVVKESFRKVNYP
jgi:hypothetical protein